MSNFLVKGADEWPIKVEDIERACGIEGTNHGLLIKTAIISHCIQWGVRGRETWNVEYDPSKSWEAHMKAVNRLGTPETFGPLKPGDFTGARPDRQYQKITFAPTEDKRLIAFVADQIREWVVNQPEFCGPVPIGLCPDEKQGEREAFFTHANRGTGPYLNR